MSKTSRPKGFNSPTDVAQVKIVGEGFDEWGDRYFKFSVKASDRDIPPFSAKQLLLEGPKPLFAALANAGWNAFTPKVQAALLQQLQARKAEASTFKVVTRLGWNSGAYVFPDEIVGTPKMRLERAFGELDAAMLGKYRVKGTLKEWQDQIADLCVGNSRLMFALSLAFTGPILRFVSGPKSGGFQLWGDAESGKTTAAMVAGSVWGCHRSEGRRIKGFVESWKSTAGKVEVTALAHNDGLLILDETKLAGNDDKQRAEVVTDVVFKLAEHTEKERLTNVGSARAWRCYFLSTSNLSFEQLGQKVGVDVDDASLGRLADIPLPANGHGLYETLHDFASGEELSDKLQSRSRRLYGTPIRAFVEQLSKDRRTDKKALSDFLAKERKTYLRRLETEANGLKVLKRTSGRFATVFAAGSLALEYGILPWKRKQLLKAILRCQLDQLRLGDADGHGTAPAATTLRVKLAQYLHDNHNKFKNLKTKRLTFGTDNIEAFPGYSDQINGQTCYYLTATRLSAIIGSGGDAKKLKQDLASEGLLDQTKNKLMVQRRIFDGGKGNQNFAWVNAFDPVLCHEAQQQ
jgi:putative DNA primase/helicase